MNEKEDSKDDQIDWKGTQVRNTTNIVRPEEKVERYIAHNLWPRSVESGCKEEAKLEVFGAVHITEEEILEGKPARGKECNRLIPHVCRFLPFLYSLSQLFRTVETCHLTRSHS